MDSLMFELGLKNKKVKDGVITEAELEEISQIEDLEISVPIFFMFDTSNIIGTVTIKKKFVNHFPAMSLSPGYQELPDRNELGYFGLIDTEYYLKLFNEKNTIG